MKYFIKPGWSSYFVETDGKTYTYLEHPFCFKGKTFLGDHRFLLPLGFKECKSLRKIEQVKSDYENWLIKTL